MEDADGPHDDEFHRVPQAQEHQEIEPTWGAIGDEGGADARRQQVGRGEEHRGDTPLQASPCADGIEEDVGGHVAAQECAGVDAEDPELADHDGVPLTGTTDCRRRCVCEWPLACPEERHIKEKSASLTGYDASATFGRAMITAPGGHPRAGSPVTGLHLSP